MDVNLGAGRLNKDVYVKDVSVCQPKTANYKSRSINLIYFLPLFFRVRKCFLYILDVFF